MTVIFFTLLSTFLMQCGYFLWKISANDEQPKIGKAPVRIVFKSLITDWRFVLGWIATTGGWILFIKATSLGDISLVQPLMSAGEFLLVILVVIFLKERLGGQEWIGIIMSIIGSIILTWNIQEMYISHFNTISLYIFLLGIILIGAILAFFTQRDYRSEVPLAMIVGLCFGAGAVFTKAMTETMPDSINILILINPFFFFMILANVLGLILLQTAFQRGRASIIVPLQVAITNIITVFAGMIIFTERITILRMLGISIILLGTFLLQSKKESSTQK